MRLYSFTKVNRDSLWDIFVNVFLMKNTLTNPLSLIRKNQPIWLKYHGAIQYFYPIPCTNFWLGFSHALIELGQVTKNLSMFNTGLGLNYMREYILSFRFMIYLSRIILYYSCRQNCSLLYYTNLISLTVHKHNHTMGLSIIIFIWTTNYNVSIYDLNSINKYIDIYHSIMSKNNEWIQ
jgi:hypothetical protein